MKDDRLYRTYILLLWEDLEEELGKRQADLIMGKIYNRFVESGKKDIRGIAYNILREEIGDKAKVILDEIDYEFQQIKNKIAIVQRTGLAITVALIFLVGLTVVVKPLNILTIPLIIALLLLPVLLMIYTQSAISSVFVRGNQKR